MITLKQNTYPSTVQSRKPSNLEFMIAEVERSIFHNRPREDLCAHDDNTHVRSWYTRGIHAHKISVFSLRERYWAREVLKICPHMKLSRINLPYAHARGIDSHIVPLTP